MRVRMYHSSGVVVAIVVFALHTGVYDARTRTEIPPPPPSPQIFGCHSIDLCVPI